MLGKMKNPFAKEKLKEKKVNDLKKNFNKAEEWLDLVQSLKKLHNLMGDWKVDTTKGKEMPQITDTVIISISQCLNLCLEQKLPSGIHQKALEAYLDFFNLQTEQQLVDHFNLHAIGIFPVLSYASERVLISFFEIYNDHFLPIMTQLTPALEGVMLSLLPGLSEPHSDLFSRTQALLGQVELKVGADCFYSVMWTCFIRSPACRCSILNFINRSFENSLLSNTYKLVPSSHSLFIRAVVIGLNEEDKDVKSTMLFLLSKHFPSNFSVFTVSDFNKLLLNLAIVATKEKKLAKRAEQILLDYFKLRASFLFALNQFFADFFSTLMHTRKDMFAIARLFIGKFYSALKNTKCFEDFLFNAFSLCAEKHALVPEIIKFEKTIAKEEIWKFTFKIAKRLFLVKNSKLFKTLFFTLSEIIGVFEVIQKTDSNGSLFRVKAAEKSETTELVCFVLKHINSLEPTDYLSAVSFCLKMGDFGFFDSAKLDIKVIEKYVTGFELKLSLNCSEAFLKLNKNNLKLFQLIFANSKNSDSDPIAIKRHQKHFYRKVLTKYLRFHCPNNNDAMEHTEIISSGLRALVESIPIDLFDDDSIEKDVVSALHRMFFEFFEGGARRFFDFVFSVFGTEWEKIVSSSLSQRHSEEAFDQLLSLSAEACALAARPEEDLGGKLKRILPFFVELLLEKSSSENYYVALNAISFLKTNEVAFKIAVERVLEKAKFGGKGRDANETIRMFALLSALIDACDPGCVDILLAERPVKNGEMEIEKTSGKTLLFDLVSEGLFCLEDAIFGRELEKDEPLEDATADYLGKLVSFITQNELVERVDALFLSDFCLRVFRALRTFLFVERRGLQIKYASIVNGFLGVGSRFMTSKDEIFSSGIFMDTISIAIKTTWAATNPPCGQCAEDGRFEDELKSIQNLAEGVQIERSGGNPPNIKSFENLCAVLAREVCPKSNRTFGCWRELIVSLAEIRDLVPSVVCKTMDLLCQEALQSKDLGYTGQLSECLFGLIKRVLSVNSGLQSDRPTETKIKSVKRHKNQNLFLEKLPNVFFTAVCILTRFKTFDEIGNKSNKLSRMKAFVVKAMDDLLADYPQDVMNSVLLSWQNIIKLKLTTATRAKSNKNGFQNAVNPLRSQETGFFYTTEVSLLESAIKTLNSLTLSNPAFILHSAIVLLEKIMTEENELASFAVMHFIDCYVRSCDIDSLIFAWSTVKSLAGMIPAAAEPDSRNFLLFIWILNNIFVFFLRCSQKNISGIYTREIKDHLETLLFRALAYCSPNPKNKSPESSQTEAADKNLCWLCPPVFYRTEESQRADRTAAFWLKVWSSDITKLSEVAVFDLKKENLGSFALRVLANVSSSALSFIWRDSANKDLYEEYSERYKLELRMNRRDNVHQKYLVLYTLMRFPNSCARLVEKEVNAFFEDKDFFKQSSEILRMWAKVLKKYLSAPDVLAEILKFPSSFFQNTTDLRVLQIKKISFLIYSGSTGEFSEHFDFITEKLLNLAKTCAKQVLREIFLCFRVLVVRSDFVAMWRNFESILSEVESRLQREKDADVLLNLLKFLDCLFTVHAERLVHQNWRFFGIAQPRNGAFLPLINRISFEESNVEEEASVSLKKSSKDLDLADLNTAFGQKEANAGVEEIHRVQPIPEKSRKSLFFGGNMAVDDKSAGRLVKDYCLGAREFYCGGLWGEGSLCEEGLDIALIERVILEEIKG